MLTQFRTRTRWNPWEELERLHDQLGRWPMPSLAAEQFPAVNVWQSEQGVIVTADLPGLAPDDIDVTVTKQEVVIRGERQRHDAEGTSSVRQERFRGAFSRTITMPFEVEPQKSEATFEKGVLTLKLGRPDQHQPVKVNVKKA